MITPLVIQQYRDHLQEKMCERSIPDHLQPGLLAYFTVRRPVGSFLTACLENDLRQAALCADDTSARALKGIVEFLAWHAPANAWGSTDAVAEWLTSSEPVPTPFD